MMFLRVFALVCLACFANAAVPADLITNLPGWNGSTPTPQYSGYMLINNKTGKSLHYWFVESENDPATDPVVLWMNGGPGCSSLDGYFYEQGPFRFVNDQGGDATGIPALMENPNRWNQIANMIFLEAPAGVGFSYSNDQNDYNTNDTQTAEDNYAFLIEFFTAYPEYSKNRFFVSGESYAGVYVPTLVEQIMNHNNGGAALQINLEGFLVGNGCTGNAVGVCGGGGTELSVDFLSGHALFSEALYTSMGKYCTDWENPSAACELLLYNMSNQINNVNIYDIYQPCINGDGEARWRDIAVEERPYHLRRRIPERRLDRVAGIRGPAECIDGITAGTYLNNPTVREAIHVLPQSQIGRWTICSSNINYNGNTDSLLPIYPTLIKNYRTLIYNGDVDACVPYDDNEGWTSGLGLPVQAPWRAWMVDSQVAGYVTQYALNNFTFLTVKGSGHMVPEYQPVAAFAMFQRFLDKQPF